MLEPSGGLMKVNPGVVLVRYGEIFLKSPSVHKRLEMKLSSNIKYYLSSKGIAFSNVVLERGRVYVYASEAERAASECACVFGVVSASPALEISHDYAELEEAVVELASRELKSNSSFAVRACRELKTYPYNSMELQRKLGSAILSSFGNLGAKVSLSSPDVEIGVEVRKRAVYVYSKTFKGVGGLPIGVEGKVVSLISGGIDSPVAAWLMMKRGCSAIFAHMDFGSETTARWLNVLKSLSKWFSSPDLRAFMVPSYADALAEIAPRAKKLTCLACKRLMYYVADGLAQDSGAKGIVTGESIGQVASQTLDNLYALSYGIPTPIYRPLIGLDKSEIIELAKKIGTYSSSISIKFTCPLAPPKPETHVRKEKLIALDRELKLAEKAEALASSVREIELAS